MKKTSKANENFKELLGFDFNQALVLFSLQNELINFDIMETKDQKMVNYKIEWKENWEQGIINFLSASQKKEIVLCHDEKDIKKYIELENKKLGSDNWLKAVLIELMSFAPYVVLDNEENDKKYNKCVYDLKKHDVNIDRVMNKYIKSKDIENYRKILYDVLIGATYAIIKPSIKNIQNRSNVDIRNTVLSLMANDNALDLFGDGFKGMDAHTMLRSIMSLTTSGVIVDNNIYDDELLKVCGGGLMNINDERSMGITQAELLNIPDFSLMQGGKLATFMYINRTNDKKYFEEVNDYKNQMISFEKECVQLKYDVCQEDKVFEKMMNSLDYLRRIYREPLLNPVFINHTFKV